MDNYKTGGARFIAMLLDGFFVSVMTSVISWLMSPEWGVIVNVVLCVAYTVVAVGYAIYMHGRFGQTLGKFITRVRVIDVSGGRITYKQAAVRDFVPLVLAPIPLWYSIYYEITGELPDGALYQSAYLIALTWVVLEMLTMLLNEKRRAVHDFIANTVVVRVP